MPVYADATCLVTLAIRDAHWDPLTRWLNDRTPDTCSSDFGMGELTSALGNRVRAGTIAAGPATAGIAALRLGLQGWRSPLTDATDIALATMFVADFQLGLRLPDAIHLAIARRVGATLPTTDRIQPRAAAAPGIACITRPAPTEGAQMTPRLPIALALLSTAAVASAQVATRPVPGPATGGVTGPTTPAITAPSRVRGGPAGVAVDPKVTALRDRALADDTAYRIVSGLTTEIGPRMDGTEAEARARTWAVARLKSLGFANVRIEPYQLSVWTRGTESAAIVAPYPQPLRIVGLGNSGATPPGGLTLPVTCFASFNDLQLAPEGSLRGRIAFVSNTMLPTQDGSSYGAAGPARFVGPSVAVKKGAAGIVIRSIGTDHGRGPHAGGTNFEPGQKPIPAAALSVADAGNVERMCAGGQPITLHLVLDDRQAGMRTSGNVVAEVPGTDPAAGIVLVGGHLDSWDLGTGAIDDGAGVAITAAAAKLLMDAGPHRRTIRVVWFGDEETGGFGGQAYAKAHAGERHATAQESDFGADHVWRFETNFADPAKAIGDRLQAALAPLGIVRGHDPAGEGTDVGPILAVNNVAAVDMGQDGLRYFDVHHTPEDTLDRIDPAQLRQNVAAWTTMLAVVADAPEDIGPVVRAR